MFVFEVLGFIVECFVQLVDGGWVFELVVGMGCVVILFVECGVFVVGIELLWLMVDWLCEKVDVIELFVVIGDMVMVRVDGEFCWYAVFGVVCC